MNQTDCYKLDELILMKTIEATRQNVTCASEERLSILIVPDYQKIRNQSVRSDKQANIPQNLVHETNINVVFPSSHYFHSLMFDWCSFNDTIFSCSFLLHWFNGTQVEN